MEDIVVGEVRVEEAIVALGNGVLADANQALGERLPITLSYVDSFPVVIVPKRPTGSRREGI